MRFPSSVHTHTTFCDGRDTPEAMARAAAEQGLSTLGFSGHSYAPQEDFGIAPGALPAYIAQIRRLQHACAGRLEVLCGIELDPDAPPTDLSPFDYVIGSCHSVQGADGRIYVVDGTPENLADAIEQGFGGDALACAAAYYDRLTRFVLALKPTIVGHFDLITKFCEKQPPFDAESAAYREIACAALDRVLEAGLVFEVNTGAMARGWRTSPYPADFLLERIAQAGGRVTLTADAHAKEQLTFGFDEALERIRRAGFAQIWTLTGEGFVPMPLSY